MPQSRKSCHSATQRWARGGGKIKDPPEVSKTIPMGRDGHMPQRQGEGVLTLPTGGSCVSYFENHVRGDLCLVFSQNTQTPYRPPKAAKILAQHWPYVVGWGLPGGGGKMGRWRGQGVFFRPPGGYTKPHPPVSMSAHGPLGGPCRV